MLELLCEVAQEQSTHAFSCPGTIAVDGLCTTDKRMDDAEQAVLGSRDKGPTGA